MVQCDCDIEPMPLYNMRVMITQNRDKKNGVVNRQMAKILCIQNGTVFLELRNGRL